MVVHLSFVVKCELKLILRTTCRYTNHCTFLSALSCAVVQAYTHTITKIQREINLVQFVVTNKAYIQLSVKRTVSFNLLMFHVTGKLLVMKQ